MPRRRLALAALAAAAIGAGVAAVLAMREHPPQATRTAPRAVRPRTRPHRAPRTPRLVLPRPLARRTVRVPIVMYHRVGSNAAFAPRITRALTVPTTVFAAQMRWLATHGFQAITQEQLFAALEHGARLPRRPVMITFDDGYRDVLWNAAPVLRRFHLRATAYVITGRLSGRDPSFLTWPELRALERDGIEIGSHTVHHVELTAVPGRVVLRELTASRRALEEALRHPVQWFAYPAGRENARVVSLVSKAGYVLAVTTLPGIVQRGRDPFRLHRDEVLDTTGVAGFAALVRG